MKRFILSAAALLAVSSAAFAADIPARAPTYSNVPLASYNWTGLYVGLSGGYAGSEDSQAISGTTPTGVLAVNSGLVPGQLNTKPSGWVFGAQAGYNWQIGSIVLGVEGDLNYSGVKGSDRQTLSAVPFGINAALTSAAETKLDWYATVRGRVGTTLFSDRFLAYGTAGWAYGDVSSSTSIRLSTPFAPLNGATAGASDDGRSGFAYGGGFEYAVSDRFTVRAEYLRLDFGSADFTHGTTILATPIGFRSSHDLTFDTFKIGANYRF